MRKGFRRFVSLVLSLALLFTQAATVFAEETYEDVVAGDQEGVTTTPDDSTFEEGQGEEPTPEPVIPEEPTPAPEDSETPADTAQETAAPVETPDAAPQVMPLAADTVAPVIDFSGVDKGHTGVGTKDGMAIYCVAPTVTISDDVGLACVTIRYYSGLQSDNSPAYETRDLSVSAGATKFVWKPEIDTSYELTAADLAGNEETATFYVGHTLGGRLRVDIPANCEEDGKHTQVYICAVCGEEYATFELEPDERNDKATGHDFGEPEEIDGCTGRFIERICQTCGYIEDTIIEEQEGEHQFGSELKVIEATCTAPGYAYYECEICSYDDIEGGFVPATGHEFSAWERTKEPNCTENGLDERHCLRCDVHEERAVKALGHEMAVVVDRPATCTEAGLYAESCVRCGKQGETREIPSAGTHTVSEWTTAVEPSCSAKGIEKGVCDVCGEEVTREIATSGEHVADTENYDCTKPLLCKNCGEVMKAAAFKGHFPNTRLSSDENGHWHKCGNNGCTVRVDYEEHAVKGDGNCMTADKCTVCGYVVIEKAAAHDYSGEYVNSTATRHARRCVNGDCSATGALAAHSAVDDGDCTTAIVCAECGYVTKAARAAHSYTRWSSDEEGHWQACTVAGCTARTEKIPHAGTDDGDDTTALLCDDCGYVIVPAMLGTPSISNVANMASGVQIAWDDVHGAAEYRVLYRTEDEWIDAGKTADTLFIWSGAVSGTEYDFTVQAYSVDNDAGPYDDRGEHLIYLAQPDAPTLTNVSTGMDIAWSPVEGAAEYNVLLKKADGGFTKIVDTRATSYRFSDVKPGVSYTFTVQAVAKDGTKSAYSEAGATLTYIAQPNVSSATLSGNTAKIAWGTVSGAAKYRVLYSANGGAWTKLTDTTATSYSWAGTKPGTKYVFTVQAIAPDGSASGYSATGKGVTNFAQPALPAVTCVNGGITVSWAAVPNASRYTLYYKTGTGKWVKLTDVTGTSYTWKSAKANTKYAFSVQAVSSDGSVSTYNTTGKSATYIAQPALPGVSIGNGSVTVTWSKVTGASKYRVYCKTGTGAWAKLADVTGTSYTWKGVKAGIKYAFSVQAIAADGTLSAYNATGKSVTYLAQPGKPTVKKASASTITVSWAKATGASKYRIYYRIGTGAWKKLADTASTSYTMSGAKKNTNYTFSVQAIAEDGTLSTYNTTGTSIAFK